MRELYQTLYKGILTAVGLFQAVIGFWLLKQ